MITKFVDLTPGKIMQHILRSSTCACLLLMPLLFLSPFRAEAQQSGSSGYQLTIYVDEGQDRWEPFGHVFLGLSDGRTTKYHGWNTSNHVEDEEGRITNCTWDVRKSYKISAAEYAQALQVIREWDTNKRRVYNVVRPGYHCGDFAEAVARAAGIPINLSWQLTGRNRPELFGEYLRAQDGEPRMSSFGVNSYVNTGISVRRGDRVDFRASGSVLLGDRIGSSGPSGTRVLLVGGTILPISPNWSYFYDVPHGALLTRNYRPGMDDLSNWALVGDRLEAVMAGDGVIEFTLNDTNPDDNRGEFRVEVGVCSQR